MFTVLPRGVWHAFSCGFLNGDLAVNFEFDVSLSRLVGLSYRASRLPEPKSICGHELDLAVDQDFDIVNTDSLRTSPFANLATFVIQCG